MKVMNFPARKLRRQIRARGDPIDGAWNGAAEEIDAARRVRTKIRRTSKKTKNG